MSLVNSALPNAILQTACCKLTQILSILLCSLIMYPAVTFFCIASIGMIVSGTSYTAAIVPIIIASMYFVLQFYLRTSRQMRYLDLEAKSPLYSHFTETTGGLQYIRGRGLGDRFIQQNLERLDESQKPYYYMFCIQRWLNLTLDVILLLVAVIVETLAVVFTSQTSESGTGLALLALLSFALYMQLCITAWTNLETSLGAMARIRHFAENTPVEEEPDEPASLDKNWPHEGNLTVSDLTTSYR